VFAWFFWALTDATRRSARNAATKTVTAQLCGHESLEARMTPPFKEVPGPCARRVARKVPVPGLLTCYVDEACFLGTIVLHFSTRKIMRIAEDPARY